MFFSEGPKTLDFTIRIGSTPTFFYVDNLYLNIAYAAHYVYFTCYTLRLFCVLRTLAVTNSIRQIPGIWLEAQVVGQVQFQSLTNCENCGNLGTMAFKKK